MRTHSAGALFKVNLEVIVPIEATEDHIVEWLRYSLGDNGSCSAENPLLDHPCDTWGVCGFDCEYSGYVGRREEFDRVDTENGYRCSVRYHRERAK